MRMDRKGEIDMHRHRNTRRATAALRTFACTALVVLLTGCGISQIREAIPPFRTGVASANQQVDTAFAEINTFLRQQQIERAITQPNINAAMFSNGLQASDIAKWDRAFGVIDTYAASLEKLLDPQRRSGVETELTALGDAIVKLDDKQLPDGLTAAFGQLGGLLLQMKSGRDAKAAIRAADPGIQAVFSQMMTAIGSSPDDAIRGTVRAAWGDVLGQIQVDFLVATPQGNDAKRAVVERYVTALDQRDAQDMMLSSLRQSLGLLASAHRELAAGRESSARELIGLIHDEYRRSTSKNAAPVGDANADNATGAAR